MSPATARYLADDRSDLATAAQQAGRFLVRAARIGGEAREQGIRVSDAEVASTLERMRYELAYGSTDPTPGASALLSLLRSSAETRADQRFIVRTSLLGEELEHRLRAKAESELPHARLAAYFARHKHDFLIPERRDVAVIQAFHKANADQARREIEAGRSLRAVVEQRNEETDVGGMKHNLTLRGLRHTYERNYFTAKPHVLVGPRRVEIYYLFEVTAIKPPQQQSLKQVESVIRRRLISGSARALLTADTRARDARWTLDQRCPAARS